MQPNATNLASFLIVLSVCSAGAAQAATPPTVPRSAASLAANNTERNPIKAPVLVKVKDVYLSVEPGKSPQAGPLGGMGWITLGADAFNGPTTTTRLFAAASLNGAPAGPGKFTFLADLSGNNSYDGFAGSVDSPDGKETSVTTKINNSYAGKEYKLRVDWVSTSNPPLPAAHGFGTLKFK